MDLFSPLLDEPINVLPMDGVVDYYGEILSLEECDFYFHSLLTSIPWQKDQALILGKLIETKRKVAWYADTEVDKPYSYTYSGVTKQSLPLTPTLSKLKKLVEDQTNETYNACLVNLYHNGEEGMAWHSDSEKDLKIHGAIASLSFGATRKFAFKHKVTQKVISLPLKAGSLLVMKGATQENWLHRLPPSKKEINPRINLTFRTITKLP